jgi:hypothetical protein
MIEAFSAEEQVEAFGQVLTLRLDFHSITVIEGDLNMQMPQAALAIRSGTPSYSLLSRVLWALFREHHQNMTLPQCLSIVMDKGKDGEKVGFALDALLDRCFPLATEDRKAKNPPKRRGRLATSASAG